MYMCVFIPCGLLGNINVSAENVITKDEMVQSCKIMSAMSSVGWFELFNILPLFSIQ